MSNNTSTDILIAGAFAAFTVDLLVYPLDTLKTRFQSPDYTRSFTGANRPAFFRGLWQGVGPVICATLPSSGAFFTTYEGTKSVLGGLNEKGLIPAPFVHSAASGLAELVSCAILTPAEVIKQNAQMVSGPSAAGVSATRQTLQKFKNNPFALWRGYTALAGRNLPFTALQFPMFERLKAALTQWRAQKFKTANGRERKPSEMSVLERALVTSVAAGSAGSVAAVVTTPIDVVKTRIMLAASEGHDDKSKNGESSQAAKLKEGKILDALGEHRNAEKATRKGSLAIAREIIQDHGWRGLFRGGLLRAVWTFAGSGLYLGVYEGGRLYLERKRGGESDDED